MVTWLWFVVAVAAAVVVALETPVEFAAIVDWAVVEGCELFDVMVTFVFVNYVVVIVLVAVVAVAVVVYWWVFAELGVSVCHC